MTLCLVADNAVASIQRHRVHRQIAATQPALLAGFSYSWIAYEVGEPIVGDPAPARA